MIIVKCDMCDKQITEEKNELKTQFTVPRKQYSNLAETDTYWTNKYDLCLECSNTLEQIITINRNRNIRVQTTKTPLSPTL